MHLTSNMHLKYASERAGTGTFTNTEMHVLYLLGLSPSPSFWGKYELWKKCLWILGNTYRQERAKIAIRSHHIQLLAVILSIVNCYVARQQVAEEVLSRERWIRGAVDYTPPEEIMNEASKEHEQSDKVRTEILVSWKEAFPVKFCTLMQSMSGETLYCASRRCSTDLKAKSGNNDFTLPLNPHNSRLLLKSWTELWWPYTWNIHCIPVWICPFLAPDWIRARKTNYTNVLSTSKFILTQICAVKNISLNA